MDGIRYRLKQALTSAMSSTALVRPGDDWADALRDDVIDNLSTDLMVTISGVENHLAAWLDPQHWAQEWREHSDEDPTDYVLGLMQAAMEEV